MPRSDLDITRTAHLWIQHHGDEATAKARPNVDQMRRKGDIEADVWLRIIVTIGTLGTPPTKIPSLNIGARPWAHRRRCVA
jgi:hypothetical protein